MICKEHSQSIIIAKDTVFKFTILQYITIFEATVNSIINGKK